MKISLITENSTLERYFQNKTVNFDNENFPFFHRIQTLFQSYGVNYDFLKFYFILKSDEISGLICFYNDIVTAFYPDFLKLKDEDIQTISYFIFSFSGASELLSSFYICDLINNHVQRQYNFKLESGTILSKNSSDFNNPIYFARDFIKKGFKNIKVEKISPVEFNEFLAENYDDFQGLSKNDDSFDLWYCDINHKIRHNNAEIFGLFKDKKLVSVCGILFKTVAENQVKSSKYLSAVCTKKDERNKGYGKIITQFCSSYENSNSYLFTDKDYLVSFYENLEYKKIGKFSILSV